MLALIGTVVLCPAVLLRWRPTADWLHGQLLGHCACLCVQALGGDLKTAWLSFSDESALEVSVTQDALYKSTSYLTFTFTAGMGRLHLGRQMK